MRWCRWCQSHLMSHSIDPFSIFNRIYKMRLHVRSKRIGWRKPRCWFSWRKSCDLIAYLAVGGWSLRLQTIIASTSPRTGTYRTIQQASSWNNRKCSTVFGLIQFISIIIHSRLVEIHEFKLAFPVFNLTTAKLLSEMKNPRKFIGQCAMSAGTYI